MYTLLTVWLPNVNQYLASGELIFSELGYIRVGRPVLYRRAPVPPACIREESSAVVGVGVTA